MTQPGLRLELAATKVDRITKSLQKARKELLEASIEFWAVQPGTIVESSHPLNNGPTKKWVVTFVQARGKHRPIVHAREVVRTANDWVANLGTRWTHVKES